MYARIKPFGPDFMKIVPTARSLSDNLTLMKFLERVEDESNSSVVGICMGEPGIISRVLGLRAGESIADAALRGITDEAGILTEPCEATGCDGDQTQFKGIFVRYLHEFLRHSGRPAYRTFLLANADSVVDNAGNPAGQFGLRWAGVFCGAGGVRPPGAGWQDARCGS